MKRTAPKQKNTTTTRNAERFMELYQALMYLDTLYGVIMLNIKEYVQKLKTLRVYTSTGNGEHTLASFGKKTKDLRRPLPKQVVKLIMEYFDDDNEKIVNPWLEKEEKRYRELKKGGRYEIKITLTWLIMLINNKLPNQLEKGWKEYEVSHRCIELGLPDHTDNNLMYRCIDIDCLNWESKSMNQERAFSFCRYICKHDDCNSGLNVCLCNEFHDPPCW